MENATLFTLASVLGLRAASLSGVVAKRTDGESVASHDIYEKAEHRFRQIVKKALASLLSEKEKEIII